MLHEEAVEPATLGLIRKLQQDNMLNGFVLVGGTALALRIGHRLSVDIDLFSQSQFDVPNMLQYLEKEYSFSLQYSHKNTLKGIIGQVFVDLITHPYPYIQEPEADDDITMLSKEDIAAMKINAITGDGTRAKDFIDVYFLLKEFNLSDILGFYSQKYKQRTVFHAVKSLVYFDDIDLNAWPNMILEKGLKPDALKKELTAKCNAYLHSL